MTHPLMNPSLSRRGVLGLAGATGAIALAGCSKKKDSGTAAASASSSTPQTIDAAAYDKIVLSGPVASDAEIDASPWAKKIKQAGVLRSASGSTIELFALLNPATGRILGFDAGMADLLAHHILGGTDVSKLVKFSETTVDTRETMLQNNTVDVVLATYSITPARAQKVAFAGPYYGSGDAVMVKADNTTITSIADLAGKKVATESNSTAITPLKAKVPSVKVQLFADSESCVAAVAQGRVDAFVLDQSLLLAAAVANPQVKVVGQPFTTDEYGIGVTRSDPTAKQFVNAFLKKIEDAGQWKQMWQLCIGPYMKGTTPTAPAIGSVPGS